MEPIAFADAVAFPDAPRCFRREYKPPPPDERAAAERAGVFYLPACTIYGYSARSSYPEDWPAEDDAWRASRAFPSVCFSSECPDGEYGFTPRAAVVEISEDELRAAAAALGGAL